MQHFIAPVQV